MPKKKQTVDEIVDEISTYHTDKSLTQDGWMTIDEFIHELTPGLREYLHKAWGYGHRDSLHHPVDLFTNASVYLDIACHVANDFIKCRHDKEH